MTKNYAYELPDGSVRVRYINPNLSAEELEVELTKNLPEGCSAPIEVTDAPLPDKADRDAWVIENNQVTVCPKRKAEIERLGIERLKPGAEGHWKANASGNPEWKPKRAPWRTERG